MQQTEEEIRKLRNHRTRQQIIGAGIIDFLKNGEGDLHIKYVGPMGPGERV